MRAHAFEVGAWARIRETPLVFEVRAVVGESIQRASDGAWFVASYCARVSSGRVLARFVDGPVMP